MLLLEKLTVAALPAQIEAFQRAGDFRKLHNPFHDFPRVGNWVLALTGSMLSRHIRNAYSNWGNLGDFVECFTVSVAKAGKPPWFASYQDLVGTLADILNSCCSEAYEALHWQMTPAEFIRTIKTKDIKTVRAGEAGDPMLRELLHGRATSSMEPREHAAHTRTPAEERHIEDHQDGTRYREITTFYEPADNAPPDERGTDFVDLEIDVEVAEDRPTEGGAVGVAPQDPDPAGHSTEATGATEVIDIEDGEPEATELQGTALWIAERGSVPQRTKGPRAEQISRALTDLLRHVEGCAHGSGERA